MASIIRQTMIDIAPADAWAALRDFGALHEQLAVGFVTDCALEAPDLRTVTFVNGAVAKERLVGFDDATHRVAYTVVESSLGFSHHNGAAQIFERGERTLFVWINDVLPDELAPTVAELMNAGIAAIKGTLEHRDVGGAGGHRTSPPAASG